MLIESIPKLESKPLNVLAFDWGSQRIGVAVGQSVTGTAQALAVIKARDGIPRWDEIAKLIVNWQPDCFLVGLPFNMDATESEILPRARKFGNRLTGRFNKPCYGFDERLSSFEAAEEKESGAIDHIAARLILESWFRQIRAAE